MLVHGLSLLLLVALIQLAICAEDYYKILGVDKQATDKQLKSAYRQLSKRYHPDKNPGDDTARDNFVQVSEAYDVLSDPKRRKIYDVSGHEGLKSHQQNGGHHDPFDIYSRFFGNFGGNSSPHRARGQNVEVRVEIALRDFYNGATTEFMWEKQHICDTCDGTGSADGTVDNCPVCDGHGMRVIKHQLAPGMFQQVQMQCDACGGRGRTVKNKCPACNGARVETRATKVTLHVERGAGRDSRVVYAESAHESPDWDAGDLIVTLVEKKPSAADNPDAVDGVFFRRKGDDLYWTEVLSLREAWMGDWTRNLTHLDSHVVRLGRGRGHVVHPGHVETLAGEGMPRRPADADADTDKLSFGNLYVTYEVVLPDQMDATMRDEFWDLWEKWRTKKGVDLHSDSGRPVRDEL